MLCVVRFVAIITLINILPNVKNRREEKRREEKRREEKRREEKRREEKRREEKRREEKRREEKRREEKRREEKRREEKRREEKRREEKRREKVLTSSFSRCCCTLGCLLASMSLFADCSSYVMVKGVQERGEGYTLREESLFMNMEMEKEREGDRYSRR